MATEEEDDIPSPIRRPELQSREKSDFEKMVATVEKIRALVEQLRAPRDPDDEDHRQVLFVRLAQTVSGGGRHLFEYHLCSRILPHFEADDAFPRDYRYNLARMWDQVMEKKHKTWWSQQAKQCINQLHQFALATPAAFFVMQRDSNQRHFAYQIADAMTRFLETVPGREHVYSMFDDSAIRSKLEKIKIDGLVVKDEQLYPGPGLSNYVVVKKLLGSRPSKEHIESAIPKIVDSIRQRIAASGYLHILKIRNGTVRINFDPDDSSEIGITKRLEVACRRGLITSTKFDYNDPREAFEWLLRPLVFFNQLAFTDVPGAHNAESPLFPANLRKRWLIQDFPACHMFVCSVNSLDKVSIVVSIMGDLRERVRKTAKHSVLTGYAEQVADDLAGKGDAGSWSIAKDAGAFARRLLGCFDRPGLHSGEYEDLLEQELYAFECHTNKAFQLARRETNGKKHYCT